MGTFVKPDKLKHKYIIGIDFGHGETSADICNIQWDANYLQLIDPESIEIFNNHNTAKSVLLIEQGTDIEGNMTNHYYVGEQAIDKYMSANQQNNDRISFYSCFKKVPSLMSQEERNVMMHFMREIYLQIRRQRTELTDDNHVVYIACPSDAKKWTSQEMTEYAQIALDAGLPLAMIDDNSVGIIRESRAAFIKARQNPTSLYSIKEGILLIDFGSSTVDLTYYSSILVDRPEDGGSNCGASRVEMEILKCLKKDNDLANDCCNVDESAETSIQLGIRQAKEDFFSFNPVELEISLRAMKMTRGKVKGYIEQYYSVEELDNMLKDYKNNIENCFKEYRDNHLQGHPIKLVFMTGGASRMDFIKDIVKRVFNYDGDFYRDNNPSLTISNGIAVSGRADLRSAALLDVLLSVIDSISEQNEIAYKAIEAGAAAITKEVLDIIEKDYQDFKDKDSDGSISMLEEDIYKSLRSKINYSSLFNEQFELVLRQEVNNSILPEMNKIVADYFPDEEIKEITSVHEFSTDVSVSTDNIEKIISNSVECISEGVMLELIKILGTIAGGALSLALAVIVKVFGEIRDLFSKEKYSMKFWDIVDEIASDLMPNWNGKDTILDSDKRSTVYEQFQKSKSEYDSIINDQLKKDLNSNETLKESIIQVFRNETKKYVVEQISQVRLMLN